MRLFKRVAIFAAMVALLAGCITEVEANDTINQATNNNKYHVSVGDTTDFAGQVTTTDIEDNWRFNTDEGQFTIGGEIQAGHFVWVELKHCGKISYSSPSAWPDCTRWDSVWGSVVGSLASTTETVFVLPTQTSVKQGVVVGCNISIWNGCTSDYRNHEFDWWDLRISAGVDAGGGYALRAHLA